MNRIKNKMLLLLIFLIEIYFYSLCLSADVLVTPTKTYTDVFIIEGDNLLYILNPNDGTINSIQKKAIAENSIFYDEPEKRSELKTKWDKQHSSEAKNTYTSINTLQKVEMSAPLLHTYNSATKEINSSSPILLRLKGNTYQNNQQRINYYPQEQRADILHRQQQLPLTKSYYSLYMPENRGYDSSRKIVLRNPSVSPNTYYTGSGIPNYGANRFSGGMGGMRGYSMAYPSGGYDVTIISNISDLFSTIDDRLVGEFPSVRIRIINR